MAKSIGGDDDDVDPNGPTQGPTSRGLRSARLDDPNGPTVTTGKAARLAPAENADDEEATWRPRRKPGADAPEEAQAGVVQPAGWLVVVKGPGVGSVLTIQNGMNILGRGPSSHIVANFGDREISREDHARFIYDRLSRRFHVAPGRGPETRLKDAMVMQPEPIVRGDLITVGKTVVRFVPFCDEGFDWTEDGAK